MASTSREEPTIVDNVDQISEQSAPLHDPTATASGSPGLSSDALDDSVPDQLAAAALLEGTATLRRSDFSGTWPFHDADVVVGSDVGPMAWVETSSGTYALNGVAISAGLTELDQDTPTSVWLDNPETGAKMSLGDLAKVALALCT